MYAVGSIETSVGPADLEMKLLLKGLFQLFRDSSARRSDFLKVTVGTTYP